MTTVEAVPLEYNGIRYRSTLEADWAAMFTSLGIYFEYEPQPWRLPSGAVYDCDFYLPTMGTYCEAKGPHNERLEKAAEFAAVLAAGEFPRAFQVLILRPAGPHGCAVWESAAERSVPMLTLCPGCQNWAFTDVDEYGDYYCRRCRCVDVLPEAVWPDAPNNPHGLPMQHAPREVRD